MKLKFEIEIDAEIEDVWAAFDDTGNLERWVRHFRSFTPLSGELGQPGSVAEFVFEERGRPVTLKATVTERREPDFLASTYESLHGNAIVVHRFESLGDGRTRWSSWGNFTFAGVMKYLSVFLVGSIRRRTEEDMQRFRLMVESDLAGS
jgi:uncharacterized protein YndB with AHSA1/START domain